MYSISYQLFIKHLHNQKAIPQIVFTELFKLIIRGISVLLVHICHVNLVRRVKMLDICKKN